MKSGVVVPEQFDAAHFYFSALFVGNQFARLGGHN